MKNTSRKRASFSTVTQKMVAMRAAVSQVTVSHILGGKSGNYNKETRESVEKAAKELGYRPNHIAQVMRRGRSNLIVHLNYGGYSELASQKSYNIGRFAHEAGFDYQVIDSYWWPEEGTKIIDRIFSFHPEGVIVSGSLQTEIDFSPLRAAGIPVVGMGTHIPGCPLVRVDAHRAIAELTRHCIRQGRHPILLLRGSGESMHWVIAERRDGYLDALREVGFDSVPEWQVENRLPGWDGEYPAIFRDARKPDLFNPFEAGERTGQWLIDKGHLPNALVCTNDFYAIGVMSVLASEGIRVPEDVMVTGFDNLSYSAQRAISLTTVEQPIEAMCAETVELLKKQIGKPQSPEKSDVEKVLPCRIQWRKSMPRAASRKTRHPVSA